MEDTEDIGLQMSLLARIELVLRNGLLSLGVVMSKEVSVSTTALLVSVFVDLMQMLAFPLNSSVQFPWRSDRSDTGVADVSDLLDFVTTDTLDQVHSTTAYLVVLSLAMAWTATFVGIALFVGYRFSQQQPQIGALLHILRSVAWLSTTVLFLPFLSVLVRAFSCPQSDHVRWGRVAGSLGAGKRNAIPSSSA